jgi:hypothetical protein
LAGKLISRVLEQKWRAEKCKNAEKVNLDVLYKMEEYPFFEGVINRGINPEYGVVKSYNIQTYAATIEHSIGKAVIFYIINIIYHIPCIAIHF